MSMIGNFKQVTPTQLQEIEASPSRLEAVLFDSSEGGASEDELNIGKTWDALHFLLSRSQENTNQILEKVILGGKEIGEKLDYDPARYVAPSEVTEISRILSGISSETLKKNFDSQAMVEADLYPSIWDEDGVFEDYLLPSFHELAEFYQDAAKKGNAVLFYIT
ncbi:MAG: YfbM family protein [bacterium]|nr:YfbM family protein [bacterium]